MVIGQVFLTITFACPVAAQGFGGQYIYQAVDDPLAVSGTSVQGINNAGQVAGYYRGADGANHGFVETHGTFTELTVPGASETLATGINGLGQVVGVYADAYDEHVFGFVETNGVYTTLDEPGLGAGAAAYGINDAGTVVGSTHGVAFTETNGIVTLLPDPDGVEGTLYAYGINNSGQIVGAYYGQDGYSHGYLDTNGTFTSVGLNVPNPAYQTYSFASGINDTGDIVGSYRDALGYSHGYAIINGVFSSFTDPGAADTNLVGVNNAGELAGDYYIYGGGPAQGFVLMPVPEAPTTVSFGLLLVLGLGGVMIAKKKRQGAVV